LRDALFKHRNADGVYHINRYAAAITYILTERLMYIEEKDTIGMPMLRRAVFLTTGIILGYILMRLFVTPYTIEDDSMLPGLSRGDLIFILKTADPGIGDIVLAQSPVESEKVILKRIIAKEGDTLEIRGKVFYRNDIKVKFIWKTLSSDMRIFPMNFSRRDNLPTVKMKRKEYFLVGDNLDRSFDSRSFGPVPEKNIIGTLLFKL
jgi:signal peptidase I